MVEYMAVRESLLQTCNKNNKKILLKYNQFANADLNVYSDVPNHILLGESGHCF